MRLGTVSCEPGPEFRSGSQNRMFRKIVLYWGAHHLSSRPVMRRLRCTCANHYGTGVSAGRFETAEGGAIFLDEVGEIPLDIQNKLLRILQENSYERVGDDRTRRANVRIVAGTNTDLKN